MFLGLGELVIDIDIFNLNIYQLFSKIVKLYLSAILWRKFFKFLFCLVPQKYVFVLKCESQYLGIFLFSCRVCVWEVREGKTITWPEQVIAHTLSLSASSTCPDTLHSARHREGSGISQRHHRVWTATAWPLQVGSHHVAPASLHHKHVLPVVCWAMD